MESCWRLQLRAQKCIYYVFLKLKQQNLWTQELSYSSSVLLKEEYLATLFWGNRISESSTNEPMRAPKFSALISV